MKTLIERRDELADKYDKMHFDISDNFTVSNGVCNDWIFYDSFIHGFDASSDIWREETMKLVEALEQYANGNWYEKKNVNGEIMYLTEPCPLAHTVLTAFKARLL